MPVVNFSVPEDVKQAFNTAFEGQNKSAVITELMREAVARAQRRQAHRIAVGRILADRRHFGKAHHLGQIAWLPDFSLV